MSDEKDDLEVEVVADEASTTSPIPDEEESLKEDEEESNHAQVLADSEGD